VSLSLPAQTKVTVEQLASFVRSSIQMKLPDKQVAATLKGMTLSQKLDGHTMEELQALGAGPRTAEALNTLREASQNLPAPPAPAPPPAPPVPIPPPSAEEQSKVLDHVREYAQNYTKNLPDFLCTQVTRRYVDRGGTGFWGSQDVFTARVAYLNHKEDYKLVMVNSKMVADENKSIHSLGGATSTGEFGSLMDGVFRPESDATFGWEKWATLRGRRAYVFNYRVPQSNSQWHVDYQHTQEIVPAYHGLVYVDHDSLSVMRISLIAELPASFPIQEAYSTLDYDLADISGHKYMLPLKAVIRMREAKYMTKNEVEFRLYRKFTAEASITFDTPDPLPEEKTQEQPAK
jgi:hypothetical protein